MKVSDKDWKVFSISEIFNKIYIAKSQDFGKMKKGKIPFVGRAVINNGFQDMVDSKIEEEGNCISIGMVSTTFKAFYRDVKFACSQNILILRMNQLTRNKALFLNSVFNSTILLKFSYGKPIKLANFKKQKILLPVNEKSEPDYEYMENYTKSKIDKKLKEYKKYANKVLANLEYKEIEPLEKKQWREFKFIDIFNIKNGFYNKKPDLEKEGNIPFIGAVDNSNGITGFYTFKNIDKSSKTGDKNNHSIDKKIFKKNAICVTNNGSVGYAYYQQSDFTCTHDVNPLYLKKYLLNKNLAMFLICCIEKQRVCFEYSRKWRPKRMIKSNILLPVNEKNEPDYEYMEQYSKNLMYKKIKQYLNYKNKEA